MGQSSHNAGRSTPPPLADLFSDYLKGQTAAQAVGLGYAEPNGEVEPFESVPVQPVDPALAWTDALAAAGCFKGRVQVNAAAPPDWSVLVAAQEPAAALAFSLGNYPQMVRDLHPLLAAGDLAALRTGPSRGAPAPALLEWAQTCAGYPQVLLAAAVLRLTRQFDEAADLLRRNPSPSEWQAVHANESAALAWHRGRAEEAATLWRKQPESVPVRFNRGMAALFMGDAPTAREMLPKAAGALPETSAWHHLARLYLALASARD